ncbi:MAG: NUDIX domain-containing protein [Lentisphaeria bacterium]|jgi:ADP-ribose pyrophosphatase YjhB (NUDIX family)|nr:NUDIX domain-containing protein [Lentisphaeria bacterium]
MKTRHRAYGYITHGRKLLLFTHPESPEAGIQVPAGTIKEGEKPQDAVMREAREETNLSGLEFVRFLDQDTRDMRDYGTDELQYRWFFHLRCASEPPNKWRHGEYADDGTLLHPFDFFWCDLDSLPKLIANYDDKIDLLRESLARIAEPDGVPNPVPLRSTR